MSKVVIVGLGNTGTNNVKEINKRGIPNLDLYVIDSQTNISMDDAIDITAIPIMIDDETGSGRCREVGRELYDQHEKNGSFDKMYETIKESRTPVFAISSSAGGTGSGAIVGLCEFCIKNEIPIVPIIVFPAKSDAAAYHLNTNDLLCELNEVGVSTYMAFENEDRSSDYDDINKAIGDAISVLVGTYYKPTTDDTIDDRDRSQLLGNEGRLMVFTAKARDIDGLKCSLNSALHHCHQPMWGEMNNTSLVMFGCSLEGMMAGKFASEVFSTITDMFENYFDIYKHIMPVESGDYTCTCIISGLKNNDTKEIMNEYAEIDRIGTGLKKSTRPSFKKKAGINKNRSGGWSFN